MMMDSLLQFQAQLRNTEFVVRELADESKTILQMQQKFMESTDRVAQSQLKEDTEILVERLESLKNGHGLWTTEEFMSPHQQADPNEYAFHVKILSSEGQTINAVGQLDTGSGRNWISSQVIERANIQTRIQEYTAGQSFSGFGQAAIEPLGIITVEWFKSDVPRHRETTFLVHNDTPYDMVLGREFIKKEDILQFDEAVLALRTMPLKQG